MQFGEENGKTWFFLERLIDGPGNALTIVITRSQTVPPSEDFIKEVAGSNEPLLHILSDSMQMLPDVTQAYKIYFDDYITYQIRNESFCSYNPEEKRVGNTLILFTQSTFLDYLTKSTDVVYTGEENSYPPGKFKHYGVYTQDHVIDIISHCEPIITKINLESQ
jgi:hypothetical protein